MRMWRLRETLVNRRRTRPARGRHKTSIVHYILYNADVAELVDALASGASASNGVEVQVLSSAPNCNFLQKCRPKGRLFLWRHAVPSICSWGEMQLGQPLAAPFWFLAAIGGFGLVQ